MDEEVVLVPRAFVKPPAEWKRWWSANQARLIWNKEQQRYQVRSPRVLIPEAKPRPQGRTRPSR